MTSSSFQLPTDASGLQQLQKEIAGDAIPRAAGIEALKFYPSGDLCTLVLLAYGGVVSFEPEGAALTTAASHQLEELAGLRLPGYWERLALLGARVNVVACDGCVKLVDEAAEILGATCQESFPAFLAAWVGDGRWMADVAQEAGLVVADDPAFRLDVVRHLQLFRPRRWYPVSSLGRVLARLLAEREVSFGRAQLQRFAAAVLSRVLVVLGAVEVDEGAAHFRLRQGLALPPMPELPPRAQPSRCELLAARFRSVVEERLEQSDAWTRVATDLERYEARRSRDTFPEALTVSDCGLRVSVDPRAPFADCLFLSRLGRLVSAEPESNTAGWYVFELEAGRASHSGLSAAEIQRFFLERCSIDGMRRLPF